MKKSRSDVFFYTNCQYFSGRNRLDSISASGISSGSYQYDAIGNLTRDTGEGLEISWNAAGKVDTIWKNGSVLSTFCYSATGQRQMKKTGNITDYYIHDASGNVVCIYRQSKHAFKAIERPIYGSKRLGELKQPVDLYSGSQPSIPAYTIGMRQYELADHLGNVLATILDRRQPYNAGDTAYKPYIINTTDYYPFGYPISTRSTNPGDYRYVFNGQEGDNEVFGEMANYTADFWQYDSRLGRRWNIDPITKAYESPYACFAGNPIWYNDKLGLDTVFADNFARQNFQEVYQQISQRIATIENHLSKIRETGQQRNWKDSKLERKMNKYKDKQQYDILKDIKHGLDDIIADPIKFTYSTDASKIKDGTGGHTSHQDDNNVLIYFRKNSLGNFVHESRHGWGVIRKEWSYKGGYDTTDEIVAFEWQQVFDAGAVSNFIEMAQRIYNQNNHDLNSWRVFNLEDAINFIYKNISNRNMIKSSTPIPAP
ncbi:MAG: hypothetical protein J5644_07555 [Bacteroidales bacterium]|nr:hypothetical protein [Bacteroidales bacterium]